jgi:hypothetical protein
MSASVASIATHRYNTRSKRSYRVVTNAMLAAETDALRTLLEKCKNSSIPAPSVTTETTPSAPSATTENTPSTPSATTENTPSTPSATTENTPSTPSATTETTPSTPSATTENTPSTPVEPPVATPASAPAPNITETYIKHTPPTPDTLVRDDVLYMTHLLNMCETVRGKKNKKAVANIIFNYIMSHPRLILRHPKFRVTVWKKADEIEKDCLEDIADLNRKELDNDLNNFINKISKLQRGYDSQLSPHIRHIKNILDNIHNELTDDPLIVLCRLVKKFITTDIIKHPEYIATLECKCSTCSKAHIIPDTTIKADTATKVLRAL